jgi:hypothetical protein
MMTVPQAQGQINLGTAFEVTATAGNIRDLAKIVRETRDLLLMMGAKLSSDWNALIKNLDSFQNRLNVSLERANRAVATMYFHDVQGAWETSSLAGQWQPLNAAYLAGKIAKSLDRRTLIASRKALESLGFDGTALNLEIGVTAVSDKTNTPYMQVQEFGSSDGRIPARPLFGPVFELNLPRYVRVYGEAIEKVLLGQVYPELAGAVTV